LNKVLCYFTSVQALLYKLYAQLGEYV